MKCTLTVALLIFTLAVSVFAKEQKDHSANYQVGTFVAKDYVTTGTVSERTNGGVFGGRGVSTKTLGHAVSYVDTPSGRYTINPPISIAAGILFGGKIDDHKAWFMDQMHPGDKVLFAAKCNKHNFCEIWVPNPDKVGKEIQTTGLYEPAVAKTNTNALCGTSKLSAAVEEQVCNQPISAPEVAPTEPPTPTPADQAKQAQQYADCLKVAVDNPSIVCKQ